MDTLSRHKYASICERIEAAGSPLLFLSLNSPDLNPIKKSLSRLKVILRGIGERIVTGLRDLTGRLIDISNPTNAPPTPLLGLCPE